MLLFVLISWVVFIVIFWEAFSTFCQSFIVIVVREGVTIRNPKTDSKSEFGGPNTVEERERSTRGAYSTKGQAKESMCAPQPGSLSAHVCHACPTRGWWCGTCWLAHFSLSWILLNSLLLPSKHNLKKYWKRWSAKFLHDFRFLILIITLSYELEIEWSKSKKCWSWRELQTPSIFTVIWVCDLSQHADFCLSLNFCMLNFFFSLSLWSSLLIFLIDRWNMLRMMLVHTLGLFDHLLIEF